MRTNLLATTILCLAAPLAACGGHTQAAKTSSAQVDLEPMDELKAIPADINTDVANLTKPIDDVQSVLDDFSALPKKYGLTSADVMGMAKATFDSGKVDVTLNTDVSAEAKAEIEAALKKLSATVTALKATPDKVASLTTKVAAATAKVPVLVGKVTASATVTASNPFGSADAKAKAKADLDSVKQVQADVMKSVSDAQAKITGIPGMASAALAKLTAAFTAGA